ncbi:MAG: dicarboxylate/amino acid:cation symporter [Richelia sp. SM1_7_0]|nr:dicarboxylate/amino acid:cation symporter [Richelia sp. SM1_7_0]
MVQSLWSIYLKIAVIQYFALPSDLLFQAMQALAVPLVVIAFIYKVDASKIARGAKSRRLVLMMIINTTVAAVIGALVFYLIYPGAWEKACHIYIQGYKMV